MAWYSVFTAVPKLFSGITDIVKEPIKGWQERKTLKAKTDSEVARIEANARVADAQTRLEMAKRGQQITADWDARAQEQAKYSWKDEALMLILFFPVMMLFLSAFLPEGFQDRIIASVTALEKFPQWYVVMLLGIVASVFGLRWLIMPLVQKFSTKKRSAPTT
jgi:cation transport ATPase